MNLPNFIIGGAQRSGTTTLWTIFKDHPQIFMPKQWLPEPKFFSEDSEYVCGLEHYAEHFEGSEGYKAIGEKSVNYLESMPAMMRIRKDLPNIKMVFILRNPIDRAYSQWKYSTKNGLENRSFIQAIQEKPVDKEHAYVARGLYAQALRKYLANFSTHVLFTEEFPHNVDSLLHFLGVSTSLLIHIPHKNEILSEPMDLTERSTLAKLFSHPNSQLEDLLSRKVPPSWLFG